VMGTSWDARMATLVDNTRGIARELTKPLFSQWNEDLASVNDWLVENREELHRIAGILGGRIAGAWEALTRPGVMTGAVGLGAGAAVGSKLGGPIAGLLDSILPRSRDSLGRFLPGFLSSGYGAVIAGAIAVIGLAIGQAASEYPEDAREVAVSLHDLTGSIGRFTGALYDLFVENAIMSTAGKAMLDFADNFTRGLSVVLDSFAIALEFLNDVASDPTNIIGKAAWGGKQIVDRFNGGDPNSLAGYLGGWQPVEGPPVSTHTTNIYGPVNVKVQAERLDDPNTVATSFDQVLRKLAEYPRGGAGARLVPKPG
jgi:hypothetical protein